MNVVVNGQQRRVVDGSTVAELVNLLEVPGDRPGVAVAVNGEVLPREEWTARRLADGDRVDVVTAVQGGAR